MATFDDVVWFYHDKENLVDYKPQGDPCNNLAETFRSGVGTPEDKAYVILLNKIMKKGELTALATFKYFTEDEAKELVCSGYEEYSSEAGPDKKVNPSQKWHLYVSYCAYVELNAKYNDIFGYLSKGVVKAVPGENFTKTAFIFGKIVKQKEFVRWVKKEAGFDENTPWYMIEEHIMECCQNV